MFQLMKVKLGCGKKGGCGDFYAGHFNVKKSPQKLHTLVDFLSTRKLFTTTNFCAAKSSDFACIQKISECQELWFLSMLQNASVFYLRAFWTSEKSPIKLHPSKIFYF